MYKIKSLETDTNIKDVEDLNEIDEWVNSVDGDNDEKVDDLEYNNIDITDDELKKYIERNLLKIKKILRFNIRIYIANIEKNFPEIFFNLHMDDLCTDLGEKKLLLKSGIFDKDYDPYNLTEKECNKEDILCDSIYPGELIVRGKRGCELYNDQYYNYLNFLKGYNRYNSENEIIISFMCQKFIKRELPESIIKLYRQESDLKQDFRKKYLKYKKKYINLKQFILSKK
jgi:hypothetical protein